MNKKYHIYKITNIINSKVYIGQSVEPKVRWVRHKLLSRTKSNQYIHHAMAKYGVDNFMFEVIDCCDSQQKLMN